MNHCATLVLENFVFKKETKFYQRRASKILSLIVSLFTSLYVECFPHEEMRFTPSFKSRIICCPSMEVLQAYLAWRQRECHSKNQYNTCFWMLVKSGKSETEAYNILKKKVFRFLNACSLFQECHSLVLDDIYPLFLSYMIYLIYFISNVASYVSYVVQYRGTQKQEKNEILFQQFGINYKNLPSMYRQGSCILKTEVDETVKIHDKESPVKRSRKMVKTVHSENIASRSFWNDYSYLCKELGCFEQNVNNIKHEYLKLFRSENKLLPFTWILIRIDGSHFHRYKYNLVHGFEKPNEEQALKLMNASAVAVLEEFNDIDLRMELMMNTAFVLKKNSQLYQRRARSASCKRFHYHVI
ncbi:putative tRNA(His) guanylyltransferase [Helianthus annuus]|nr:putative tRNA(His) guanylyltransferase [Helianthus annuus]